MKARIIMDVDVPDGRTGAELRSNIAEAMAQYERNGDHFDHCVVRETWRQLATSIPSGTCELLCLSTFTATHTNSVNGAVEQNQHDFTEGHIYWSSSWRPEGTSVDGFFVFHKHASKFAIEI